MRTHAFMNHLVQSNRYPTSNERPHFGHPVWPPPRTLERFSSRLQWGAPWPPCAASVNPENHLWGWRWRPHHLRLATFRRVWCLWSMARTYATHPRPVMNGKQETTRNFVVCYLILATLLNRDSEQFVGGSREIAMTNFLAVGDKFGVRKKGTKILDFLGW